VEISTKPEEIKKMKEKDILGTKKNKEDKEG